jgi:hypothetical protein
LTAAIPYQERGYGQDTGRQKHGRGIKKVRWLKVQRIGDFEPAELPYHNIMQNNGDQKIRKNCTYGKKFGLEVRPAWQW